MTGRRAIEVLSVRCSNSESCEWVGTIGTLEKHLAACLFTILPCPKSCTDSNNTSRKVMRKDLEDHLKNYCPFRDYKCLYCGETGTYVHIREVHDSVCLKKPLPCINPGCQELVQRCDMEKHLSTMCDHTIVSCKYAVLGCSFNVKRCDMVAHVEGDRQSHLDMAVETTMSLKSKVSELEQFRTRSEATMAKLENAIAVLQIESKSSTKGAIKATAQETAKKGTVKKKKEKAKAPQDGQYISTFKVRKYADKKGLKKSFRSQSFYTKCGYNLAIEVCVYGNGMYTGTHVSVFVHVMKGRNDSKLSWPLVGEVTITLVNQVENKNHYSTPLSLLPEHNLRPGKNLGYRSFIPHKDLAFDSDLNTQYLKQDCLEFRVSFKV